MYEQECDNVLHYINSWVRKSGGVMKNDAELAKMEFDVENMGQTRLIAIWGLGIAVATFIFDQLDVELAQLMQDLIDWL